MVNFFVAPFKECLKRFMNTRHSSLKMHLLSLMVRIILFHSYYVSLLRDRNIHRIIYKRPLLFVQIETV